MTRRIDGVLSGAKFCRPVRRFSTIQLVPLPGRGESRDTNPFSVTTYSAVAEGSAREISTARKRK